MIIIAAKILNVTTTEIRKRIAILAHFISNNEKCTQSEAWSKAWGQFKKQIAMNVKKEAGVTVAEKLDDIISNSKIGTWDWGFATDNAKRIMDYGDKVIFSAKQLAKIEELYAEV